MSYWLLKTEPEEFSWDDQVKRGAKGEPWRDANQSGWDGVLPAYVMACAGAAGLTT